MEGSMEGEDACISFSANKFYGERSRCEERAAMVAKGAKYIKQHPLPSEFEPGIFGPPKTWKIFRRQAEAIKFAQLMGQGLMVFSFESDTIGSGGKRSFLVTHPTQMWLRQSERIPEKRCTYEVIQESSVCKLYFDLEFLYANNPSRDGVAMTNTLIQITCHFLHKEFNVACSRKNIIDLRGTSDLKFSRHLIFNIPGIAFATNYHVGVFVKKVCNTVRLWKNGIEPVEVPNISLQNIKDLFVLDSKGSEVMFCDEGVYSKNRNFRLFLSTKFGQNYPLVIAEENEYLPDNGPQGCKDKQIFLDSLITLVDNKCKVLTCKDTEQPPKEHEYISSSKKNIQSDVEGIRQSPYPEIDGFIQSMISSGKIHSWHYFSQSETIVYNIVQYRFCYNINREHKSNNIFYVVSVKDACYYQKCHDPDCRDFRSPTLPLPKDIVFWQNMDEDRMMDWIQSVEDENDSTGSTATEVPEDGLQNLLVDAANVIEKWDRIDELISSQSTNNKSPKSSQRSSHSYNPWDRLSQLSSPNTSLVEDLSQLSQPLSFDDKIKDKESESSSTYDAFSDEEFLEAVHHLEEQLECVGSELEISG